MDLDSNVEYEDHHGQGCSRSGERERGTRWAGLVHGAGHSVVGRFPGRGGAGPLGEGVRG